MFYDRANEGIARFLPDFLLPGPLAYAPTIDAILTVNSAFQLLCYK